MDITLYEYLKNYSNTIYPMHMPGHKMGRLGEIRNLYKIDVTEVEGTDNLHEPTGIIQKAQEKAAAFFGASHSFFLVNGSTVGLMAAITAICKEGDQLIIARNCHRSVYDGIITTGIKPTYIFPKLIRDYGLVGGISPIDVQVALEKNPDAKGVVITSPTYEGFTSNIGEIAKIVHRQNKVLIVDEAHGAHFNMHECFPETALSQGADIVVQSLHKTLPALTQSAILHVKGNNIQIDKIQSALSLYETSSPSYILMASIDECRHLLEHQGNELYQEYYKDLLDLRAKLMTLGHLQLIENQFTNKSAIEDFDRSKIIISTRNTDISGIALGKSLRDDYHIQVEMATENYLLAMSTIADSKEDLEAFYLALKAVDSQLKHKTKEVDIYNIQSISPEIALIPRSAYFSATESVSLHKTKGLISGDYIIPYPPGIPLIVPGEVITDEILHVLKYYLDQGINILGTDKIKIIKREVKI